MIGMFEPFLRPSVEETEASRTRGRRGRRWKTFPVLQNCSKRVQKCSITLRSCEQFGLSRYDKISRSKTPSFLK